MIPQPEKRLQMGFGAGRGVGRGLIRRLDTGLPVIKGGWRLRLMSLSCKSPQFSWQAIYYVLPISYRFYAAQGAHLKLTEIFNQASWSIRQFLIGIVFSALISFPSKIVYG